MAKENKESRALRREQLLKAFRLVSKVSVARKAVFGGAFNHCDSRHLDLFACVAGNRVAVYRCAIGASTEELQVYRDEDDNECFYTVSWLRGEDGAPLMAASGATGVIRIIHVAQQRVVHSMVGHGGSVNELRTHPREPTLVISASKDESLRLWSSSSGVCALVLGGARGHRNEVLSADFHPSDKGIVATCGMDSTIRVWSLHHWWSTVELSKTWKRSDGVDGYSFPTKIVQYPIIVVPKIHTNYIDCLRFLGNFFLTKSVDNEVVVWRWCAKNSNSVSEGIADVLLTLPTPECDIWFLKFAVDGAGTLMAAGSRSGKAHVWDLASCPPAQTALLQTKECKAAIRQTAISYCGRTIMCCCDDGTLWRWEKVKREEEKKP